MSHKIWIASALAGCALAAAASGASARDLTVVSWGGTYQDAQNEIYFKPFAEKSGKPLLAESWDGGYGVLQAKVKAGQPNWDVVQVETEELELGCADGIYQPIDWEKLGGEDRFIPGAASECGVGAIVWSVVIGYDGDRISGEGPTNWADFWDVKKFPGKRGLRKSPKYALEFALMADGVAPGDVYDVLGTPEGVDRAFAKLDELRSDVIWWEAGAQPLSLLQTGEVAMSAVYNGRITGLNKTEGTNLKIVWPGSIYALDSWVILSGAENADAAMDFIAFASSPENMVKLPEHVAYGLPNKEAAAAVPAALGDDLPTSEANLKVAIPLDGEFWVDHSEELTARFNAWLAK